MAKVFNKLRTLDAYPKINEDFYSRTFSGGLITLVSSLLTLFLFFSEFRLYLHTVTDTQLLVDTSRGEKLHINFDVTFPSIPCSLLSVDATDISGEQHIDILSASGLPYIKHDITKKRIDAHHNVIDVRRDKIGATKIEKPLQKHGGRLQRDEKYCGTCYGAETSDEQCCNSCEEVRQAYKNKGWSLAYMDSVDQCEREGFVQRVKEEDGEGCNIYGSLEVNKVAGNFHFSPGKSFLNSSFNLQDLISTQTDIYNISHKINRLSFGDYFPGAVNPLDGVGWSRDKQYGMYQYFIKVVPTIYTNIGGRTVKSNQYSVTEHLRTSEIGHQAFPGVFFFYDFSPIKVTFKEEHISFLRFMTNICAVVGGIFTVAGIVDSFVYHGQRAIKKKTQLGKYS
ncbi:hypothetical protein SAY87_014452 [Trapa incisa]|uniref:Endoplasmic reticulum-Golgi intermediate compartment protein 3-like n=1 Tax=Trapa incisa TaxID=236973 RepID=A0AAN7GK05_9MYRT|nr:hypothetical protein SAY87_014452 [Trapa incisa]